MRVLLDAMDGSNEIPEDMRDLIEKLIFDETPPSAKEILKLDSLLDAKTLEDLQNVRRDSSLGSTERIVACDDVVRRALQNLKVVMRMMVKLKAATIHASIFIEESMHAITCASKAHLEKYSRRSMERAMTSASLFQSCSEYLCALEHASRTLSLKTTTMATNIGMEMLRKPKHLAKCLLLSHYSECLEIGANESVSSSKGGSSAKEMIHRINGEGPSFRRELLHPAVMTSVSAVGSDFDFEEKILPSVLTIATSPRTDVNGEEFTASMAILEQIISRLCTPVLLRLVVAPLISVVQFSINRDSDGVDRAKQAIEMIRDARRLPAHLDFTEFMSLAATELKSQKDNIKKIEREKSREIALLSLERYVATGGDSGIGDIDDSEEEEMGEMVVKKRSRGPWHFLPEIVLLLPTLARRHRYHHQMGSFAAKARNHGWCV